MRKLWKRAAALVVSAALAGAMLPSAFSEEATDAVEAKLTTMTLREKVGQLFWVRPETLDFSLDPEKKTLTQTMRKNLEQYPVGGIAVFKKNIQDENQLSSLIADFQSASKIPMIVAVDEEGGAVARLAYHEAFSLPKYTSARDIGKTGDPEQARQMGRTIGGYLRFYGFNLDFAPVADVDSNPANPVIGRRAYSTDAQQTAQMVAAAVEGFHEAGMLCTVKHFPGHGDTGQDSHYGTATSYKTWEEMKAMEMLPFEAGIAAGADVVMTAHITTPNATTDGLPASLSYTMITERLRGELGFQGVIVTDSLGMYAIKNHFTPAESAVAALRAGVDVLLMPSDLRAAFDGVVQAVEDGTLSEERLNESVRRILTLKQKAGLDLSGSSAAKQPVAEKTSDTKCSFSGWLKKLWYRADTAA